MGVELSRSAPAARGVPMMVLRMELPGAAGAEARS